MQKEKERDIGGQSVDKQPSNKQQIACPQSLRNTVGPMNIFIKTLAGSSSKDITVQVNPSDNVATLKENIYKSAGIPVDQQILIFCGRLLEDECTFTECNIQKDSTVHLALKAKDTITQVTVKLVWSMDTVRLDLTANLQCTVIDVKEKLQLEWGILPQNQTLMHNGLKLPDECKLLDCRIMENSELELIVSFHSCITVEVTVPSLEETISLKLNEGMTIIAVKRAISKISGIKPYQQRLQHAGKKLKDDHTLSQCTGSAKLVRLLRLSLIKKTTICIMQQHGRRVFLHMVNKIIGHIKKKIEKSKDLNIPYDHQMLIYGEKKLEENKSLDDYNIPEFDELELVEIKLMKIHIHIIHSQRVIEYEMGNSDTVGDVKKRIQEYIGVTNTTKLVVYSGGIELKDDRLLYCCSTHCEHSTLQVMLPMTNLEYCPKVVLVNVFVLSSNETVQLKLDPGDTVAMVKSKIRLQLKIPSNEQRLIYADLELENEHKLFEYSIQKNSTLQLLISNQNMPVSPDRQHSDDPIPTPSTMKILLRLNPELVKYIDFVTLLPYLNKYEILTTGERQFLNDDRKQHEKRVSNLLEYLEKKNDETVDAFVRAMNEEPSHNGHKELCRLLKEEGIKFI